MYVSDTARQPGKRRKRKSSTGSATNAVNNNSIPPTGKQKRSPGPQGIGTSVPGVSSLCLLARIPYLLPDTLSTGEDHLSKQCRPRSDATGSKMDLFKF